MQPKIQAALAFGAAAILYTGTMLNASDRRTADLLERAKESGADTTALLADRGDMNTLQRMADGNDYIVTSGLICMGTAGVCVEDAVISGFNALKNAL